MTFENNNYSIFVCFQVTHRTLAAQLCGIFVNVEKEAFESRLADILPLVLKQFHAEDSENSSHEPGRFVRLQKPKVQKKKKTQKLGNINIKDPERMKDHHLFQVLQLCLKISANCPSLFKNAKYEDSVRSLAGENPISSSFSFFTKFFLSDSLDLRFFFAVFLDI